MKLTKEENDIRSSVERGEWSSTIKKSELQKYQEAARLSVALSLACS